MVRILTLLEDNLIAPENRHVRAILNGVHAFAKDTQSKWYNPENDSIQLPTRQLEGLIKIADDLALDYQTPEVKAALRRELTNYFAQQTTQRDMHPLRKTILGMGLATCIAIATIGCGSGSSGGGNTPVNNPDNYQSIAEVTVPPQMLPAETLDFWMENTHADYQLSEGATSILQLVQDYFISNPNATLTEWGVTPAGILVKANIIPGTGDNTDSDGDGIEDKFYLFTSTNSGEVYQTEVDEIDSTLNTTPNGGKSKELVEEVCYHEINPSDIIDIYADSAVFLYETGESVDGDPIVEYTPNIDSVVAIFSVNPTLEDENDAIGERALNGQDGGVYSGLTVDIIQASDNPQSAPAETSGWISKIVYETLKFHENNN